MHGLTTNSEQRIPGRKARGLLLYYTARLAVCPVEADFAANFVKRRKEEEHDFEILHLEFGRRFEFDC